MTDTTSTTTRTNSLERQGLLRRALRLDAVVTSVNGLAYLALAGPLSDLLGMPAGFLRAVGVFLAVYAVAVWTVGARERTSIPAASAVVAGNAVWVAGSVVAVALGLHDPTTTGNVWIALQAFVVAGLADLQLLGIRRTARA